MVDGSDIARAEATAIGLKLRQVTDDRKAIAGRPRHLEVARAPQRLPLVHEVHMPGVGEVADEEAHGLHFEVAREVTWS